MRRKTTHTHIVVDIVCRQCLWLELRTCTYVYLCAGPQDFQTFLRENSSHFSVNRHEHISTPAYIYVHVHV